MRNTIVLLLLVACGIFNLSAQHKNEIQFGVASPLGEFAEKDEVYAIFNGAGYAADGFYLGYKSLSPFTSNEFFWTLSANLTYNKLGKGFEDYFNQYVAYLVDQSIGYGSNVTILFPKYLSVPVLAGLQYEKSITKNLKLYGEVGFGFNILKITDFDIIVDGNLLRYNFDPSVKVAYKFGCGAILRDRITINMTYLSLGSNSVKYTYEASGQSEDGVFDPSLTISTLNVGLGLRF